MVLPVTSWGNLITTSDVRDLLGCSVRTVHRLVASGDLAPALKLPGPNGAFLFDPEAVENYKAQRDAA